jgi:hypothetical protein
MWKSVRNAGVGIGREDFSGVSGLQWEQSRTVAFLICKLRFRGIRRIILQTGRQQVRLSMII